MTRPAVRRDREKQYLTVSSAGWTILSTNVGAVEEFVGMDLWEAFPHWESRTRKYWEYARDHGHCSILVFDERGDRIFFADLSRDGDLLKCEAEVWEPQRVMLLRDSLGAVLDDLVRRLAAAPDAGSPVPTAEDEAAHLRLVDD